MEICTRFLLSNNNLTLVLAPRVGQKQWHEYADQHPAIERP